MQINLIIGFFLFYFISPLCFSFNNTPKTVVICDEKQCPTIPSLLNPQEKFIDQAIIYQTDNKPEFMVRNSQSFTKNNNSGWQHITINESDLIDTHPIIGFGGSFTDSTAMLYQHLSYPLRKSLINAYFSTQGIAYSLGRVPIASSDFSCRQFIKENGADVAVPSLTACSERASPYTYADTPDLTLKHFSLQSEDLNFKIPMIQAAIMAVQKNQPNGLRLFASPWSAPAWMKTNGNMVHGSLNPQFQSLWASYFVKFLQAYQQHNIIFWGLTVQNEPVEDGFLGKKGMQTWQTMYSTPEQEAEFVKFYLGPTLKQFENEYGSNIHLMIHDDQISTVKNRVAILSDLELAKYIDGAGLHWYMNLDSLYKNLDQAYQTLNLSPHHKRFIIGTEACEGYLPTSSGPSLGSWSRGEAYAHDIINDLNHHVSGWTDWNLLLDMNGGPNWAKNYVDAPILVDLSSQTLYLQPMYYYLGHFSKFIRPGSQLLASQSSGPFPLEEVAFKVPADGKLPETIVIVVLNKDITARNYYIQDNNIKNENKYLNMHIPARGIQTIIYQAHESINNKDNKVLNPKNILSE